ncbi:hypothetical protein [Burkholderia sp. Bp8984]|uniref:hypothetical protein n=1 Tax=Burkholderia sp. Bp8984 TaxID=2184549 RepID=UPI000F5A83AB|nr:hypothetical protein [Burkholderia sp. Bp8984]
MSTQVFLAPTPILAFLNNAGQPNAGGSVLTQVGGVNYPTYQDAAGTTPLPNPIPLNSRGEISNSSGISSQLFLAAGVTYVFTLYDANGNQINQATWVASSALQASEYASSNLARSVDSMAAARALNSAAFPRVHLTGYYSARDGGGGAEYCLDPSDSTSPDDGGSIYIAADGGRMKIVPQAIYGFKQWGAKADSTGIGIGTDNHPMIQACIAFAVANGADVYGFGQFRSSAGFTIDYSSDTTLSGLRTAIKGGGSRQTVINFDNGAFDGFHITGNTAGGAISMMHVEGIGLFKTDRSNTAITLTSHSHLTTKDVMCQGWNLGMSCVDVQESFFENVYLLYNNGGFQCAKNTFTQPNALSFMNCTFGLNTNFGADFQNPSALDWQGGSIESNGTSNSSGTLNSIWGARIIINTALTEGSISASFNSAYIENNGSATNGVGSADIWYVNSASNSMLTVQDCTFQRHSLYCTNNIKIDTSGGFKHKIRLRNGHKGYADYTASSSRPYWQVLSATDNVEVDDTGSSYDNSIEAPNLTGSANMANSMRCAQSNIGGYVRFNGTNGSIVSSFGVASVTRTSAGTYTVSFARNQPNAGARCYQSMLNNDGVCELTSENAGGAVFVTKNLSGVAADYTTVMISWIADPAI